MAQSWKPPMRPSVAALGHLLVDDAAAGRHPLDVARADDALVAHAVAVLDRAAEHVGDRLDAAVGVPGEAGQVLGRIVLAEVVEHQEGIEQRDFAEAEAAAEVDARPFERGLADEDLLDLSGLVHVVPSRASILPRRMRTVARTGRPQVPSRRPRPSGRRPPRLTRRISRKTGKPTAKKIGAVEGLARLGGEDVPGDGQHRRR